MVSYALRSFRRHLTEYKVCSALDPDKGTELELTVYTLTVHDGGVNQGLCAESKMYIDDLRVKSGVILGRGWEVHVFLCERAALRLRCSAAGRGVLSWAHVAFVSAQRCCTPRLTRVPLHAYLAPTCRSFSF